MLVAWMTGSVRATQQMTPCSLPRNRLARKNEGGLLNPCGCGWVRGLECPRSFTLRLLDSKDLKHSQEVAIESYSGTTLVLAIYKVETPRKSEDLQCVCIYIYIPRAQLDWYARRGPISLFSLAVLISQGKNHRKNAIWDPQNEFPGAPWIGCFLALLFSK